MKLTPEDLTVIMLKRINRACEEHFLEKGGDL